MPEGALEELQKRMEGGPVTTPASGSKGMGWMFDVMCSWDRAAPRVSEEAGPSTRPLPGFNGTDQRVWLRPRSLDPGLPIRVAGDVDGDGRTGLIWADTTTAGTNGVVVGRSTGTASRSCPA